MSSFGTPLLLRPDAPLEENLTWLSDVLPMKDGSSQRVQLRIAPRQSYVATYMVEDDIERQLMENLLYAAQASTYAVPKWTDATFLTSTASAGSSTVHCATSTSDFRPGESLVLLSNDDAINDGTQATIISTTASTITFLPGLNSTWQAGTQIYPVAPAVITAGVPTSRNYNTVGTYKVNVAFTNNSTNLAGSMVPPGFSTMAFGDDAGSILLSDPNWMKQELRESSDISVVNVDGKTGVQSVFSYQNMPLRGSYKSFISNTPARLWQLRQFVHYIQGQQTAFLLPTFADDLTLSGSLTAGSSTFNITNTGYTGHIGANPRKYIAVYNTVTGVEYYQVVSPFCAVINASTEQVSVYPSLSTNLTSAQVSRISLVERQRFATDTFKFTHDTLPGTAHMGNATRAVTDAVFTFPSTSTGASTVYTSDCTGCSSTGLPTLNYTLVAIGTCNEFTPIPGGATSSTGVLVCSTSGSTIGGCGVTLDLGGFPATWSNGYNEDASATVNLSIQCLSNTLYAGVAFQTYYTATGYIDFSDSLCSTGGTCSTLPALYSSGRGPLGSWTWQIGGLNPAGTGPFDSALITLTLS